MKRHLILILTMIFISCNAQQIIPLNSNYLIDLKQNDYIKDIDGDLDKFVGAWKWTDPLNPNTYFEVHFSKILHWNPNNIRKFYTDKIVGNYIYVVNGSVIVSTLNNLQSNPNILSNSTFPFEGLSINMTDTNKDKTCKANFDIIDMGATPMQATWHMYIDEQIHVVTQPIVIQQGFTLPNDVVLTKQ